MLKNKKIIVTILFILALILIPNIVRAEKKDLSLIEVTVPEPTVGKTPATLDEVVVKADGQIVFENIGITWYIWDYENDDYKEITDSTQSFEAMDEYAVAITYKRSFDYNVLNGDGTVLDDLKLLFNGIELDAHDFNTFSAQTTGDTESGIDCIYYEFGFANKEKNISTLDVTVPEPEIGKKQPGLEAFSVKIDGDEKLNVIIVEWLKYNSETDTYETDSVIAADVAKGFYGEEALNNKWQPKNFEEGAKYKVHVTYSRPSKYGYSEDVVAKINGVQIDTSDIDQFDVESSGEPGFYWDAIIAEFSELKKYENAEDDKESNKEQDKNLGNSGETTKEESSQKKEETTKKEDPTKAGGTIPYTGGEVIIILSALALIGLMIYLYRKNKDLRGV